MNPNEVVQTGDMIFRVARRKPEQAKLMVNHLAMQVVSAIANGTAVNGRLCAKLTHEIFEELTKPKEML